MEALDGNAIAGLLQEVFGTEMTTALGMCATCGASLNRETCDCKSEWEDPRLAVLKALKDRESRH